MLTTPASQPAAIRLRRRIVVVALAVLVAAGILAVALRSPVRLPPSVSANELDPAVVAAIEQARTAIVRAPRSGAAWGRLGMVFLAHHIDRQARDCFVQAEALDPQNPRWPYLQAMLLSLEDSETTIVKLQRTAEICPEAVDAPRLRLAEAFLAAGRLDAAEAGFLSVLGRPGENPRARLGLARVEFNNDRLADAVSQAASALSDRRTRKAAHVLLAEIEQRRGNHAQAAAALRTAAKLPEDAPWPDPYLEEIARHKTGWQASLEQAQSLLKSGNGATAAALLRQTAGKYPAAPYVWLTLGRCLVETGDIDGAEQAFRSAVRLQGDSADANYHLGVVLLARKKLKEATASLKEAVTLKPDFAEAHLMLARSILLEGDDRGAIDSLRTAVRCKPQFGDAYRALGELLYEAGEREEALVLLQTAANLNPDDEALSQILERVRKEEPPTKKAPGASEVPR